MTNTILDGLNLMIFSVGQAYVTMKLGDTWIDIITFLFNNYNHSSILTDLLSF